MQLAYYVTKELFRMTPLLMLLILGCDPGADSDDSGLSHDENGTEKSDDTDAGTDTGLSGSTDSRRDTESISEDDSSQSTLNENSLSLALSCDYVLDNAKTVDGEYLEEHKTTIQIAPAFFGKIGHVVIPESGAEGVHYEVFGLKRDDRVIVLQMAFEKESQKPVNPFIQLSLDASRLASGSTFSLGSAESFSRSMIFNVKDNLEFDCVYGVIEGQINVKQAENLDRSEGGILWLHGYEMPVFPVEASSVGDLTELFNDDNKQTCVQLGRETGL